MRSSTESISVETTGAAGPDVAAGGGVAAGTGVAVGTAVAVGRGWLWEPQLQRGVAWLWEPELQRGVAWLSEPSCRGRWLAALVSFNRRRYSFVNRSHCFHRCGHRRINFCSDIGATRTC